MFKRRKTLDNQFPMHHGIRFVHRNPHLFNIGDFLCSPRHYFNFSGAIAGATIVGGGIFDPRKKIISKFDLTPENTAIWGAGFGQGINERERFISELPFLDWGYRDVKYIPEDRFLPCVSCFHPVATNAKQGASTVVFLNDDPKITPYEVRTKIEAHCATQGWLLIWNSTSETNLVKTFARANKIITNSFHGAYWGLLSGREVKVLAHNMKFINLLDSVGLDGTALVHQYEKQRPEVVFMHLAQGDRDGFVALENAAKTRAHFQSLNLAFAQRLVASGLVAQAALADHYE